MCSNLSLALTQCDRVDTANRMSKDMTFTDARVTKHDYDFQDMSEHCLNGERMHEYLQEMRVVALDEFDREAILVGELPGTDPETLKQYVLQNRRELSMTFDFDMMVSHLFERDRFGIINLAIDVIANI
jgi:oligo-1,6-glucosidase